MLSLIIYHKRVWRRPIRHTSSSERAVRLTLLHVILSFVACVLYCSNISPSSEWNDTSSCAHYPPNDCCQVYRSRSFFTRIVLYKPVGDSRAPACMYVAIKQRRRSGRFVSEGSLTTVYTRHLEIVTDN